MARTASEVATSTRTMDELRAQQAQMRYPQLLIDTAAHASGVVYRRARAGSGLIVTAVRHDALTSEQRHALAAFRLQQFVLCGWYNLAALQARGVETDPALDDVPPATVHGLVGTIDGRLLAYYCIQPAETQAEGIPSFGGLQWSDERHLAPTMGTPGRPLFPTEIELCGPEVFASLPALRETPVDQVRELTYFLRNQAISAPRSFVATVEAFHSEAQILMDPQWNIGMALGNGSSDLRRALAYLGMPVLYAPAAKVAPRRLDYYWLDEVHEPGRFWPFVIATSDLRTHAPFLGRLDDALSLPPRQLVRALRELVHQPVRTPPLTLLPDPAASTDTFWTADPSDLDKSGAWEEPQ